MNADRTVVQILMAYMKPFVNLNNILRQELSLLPLELEETNGWSRTWTKAILADALLKVGECPTNPGIGQALIINLRKPHKTNKFGALSDIIVQSVLSAARKF